MATKQVENYGDAVMLLYEQIQSMDRLGNLATVKPDVMIAKLVQNQTVMMTSLLILCKELGLEKRNKLIISSEPPKS